MISILYLYKLGSDRGHINELHHETAIRFTYDGRSIIALSYFQYYDLLKLRIAKIFLYLC